MLGRAHNQYYRGLVAGAAASLGSVIYDQARYNTPQWLFGTSRWGKVPKVVWGHTKKGLRRDLNKAIQSAPKNLVTTGWKTAKSIYKNRNEGYRKQQAMPWNNYRNRWKRKNKRRYKSNPGFGRYALRKYRQKPTMQFFAPETKKILKYINLDPSVSGVASSDLIEIAQGYGATARVGTEVGVKGISLSGYIKLNTRVSSTHRLIILTPRNSGVTTGAFPTLTFDKFDPEQAVIHADRLIHTTVYPTGNAAHPSAAQTYRPFKIWVPMNQKIKFNGSTTTSESMVPILMIKNMMCSGDDTTEAELEALSTVYFVDP